MAKLAHMQTAVERQRCDEDGDEDPDTGVVQRVCFVVHASRGDIIQGLFGHLALAKPLFEGGLVISGESFHRSVSASRRTGSL